MIDCVKIANDIKERLKTLVTRDKGLAIIQVGNVASSDIYVRHKMKDAEELGVPCMLYHYDENVTNEEVITLIEELNQTPDVKGIIVQLPLPKHLNVDLITDAVTDEKDIDGFKFTSKYTPCTPKGIMTILDSLDMELAGKTAVVIGKGKTVGRPLINLLLDRGVTVTTCHSKTPEHKLHQYTWNADIIISAVGKPNMVTTYMAYGTLTPYKDYKTNPEVFDKYEEKDTKFLIDMIEETKKNKVIIDVGISRDENGKQIGDCQYELRNYIDNITGYTNAVGLMTRVSLFQNLLEE